LAIDAPISPVAALPAPPSGNACGISVVAADCKALPLTDCGNGTLYGTRIVSVFEGVERFSSSSDELLPGDELASAAGEVVSVDASDGPDAGAVVVAAVALFSAAASPLVKDELPVSSYRLPTAVDDASPASAGARAANIIIEIAAAIASADAEARLVETPTVVMLHDSAFVAEFLQM
jgi:hypothetical protein